jgi:integrase
MTYKPDEKLSPVQVKKELQRQTVLFEENVKRGQMNTAVKFQDYATEWFAEVANLKLKVKTIANYRNYSKRVFKSLGHYRMDKLTTRDIQRFILEMHEGARLDRYKKGGLSPKTIRNHIAFVSTIFEHAIKMQIVSHNPCKNATLPKDKPKEREIYSLEEAQRILQLLQQEDDKNFQFVVFFTLAVYTGFRVGEILGIEWKPDIDFQRCTLSINRTSGYTPSRGIFTDSPKTKNSYRTLKLPPEIMDLLKSYQQYQNEYAKSLGSQWENHDRLFIKWNGSPIFPNTPALFFGRFCKRHGIRYINPHGWRHFCASAQVFAGIDVKTISMNLGHSTPQTTLNIYCKAFQMANAAAMEKMIGVIGLPEMKQAGKIS